MSEHDVVCGLLADLIQGQKDTTEAVVRLTEAIAAAGSKTKPATGKPATDTKPAPALEVGRTAAVDTTTATPDVAKATPDVALPATSTITFEQARDWIITIPTTDAKAYLAKLGAKRLSDLKPTDYDALWAMGHAAS